MEPVTHFLTGACIGRTGFNRKTTYATLAAVLAAEAADLDVLWGFAGPVEELKHHRGITHTFVGAPAVAGVVLGAIWLFHRWQKARKPDAQIGGHGVVSHRKQPGLPDLHWGWVYVTALVAALSHILLDWLNNYGVRPFFPFSAHWYAGSIVFIAEPVFWALLLLALVMPWLLGLADREIGVRKKPFRGQGWAIFALTGMALVGLGRWVEYAQGVALLKNSPVASERVERVALEPYPVNPFHWHAILETKDFYQTAEVDTWNGTVESNPETDVMYKPAVTPAVQAAKQTFLGRVYLDWGKWAVVRDVGQEPAPGIKPHKLPPGQTWTTVEFIDLRFDYPFLGTQSGTGRTPLAGWVYIVDGRYDAGEVMDGRGQEPPSGRF